MGTIRDGEAPREGCRFQILIGPNLSHWKPNIVTANGRPAQDNQPTFVEQTARGWVRESGAGLIVW